MIDFLHTLTGPPFTVTTLSTYKGKKNTECIVTWTYPKQPSYLARIDAVELQLKQNKLFDSWKTVGILRGSERPPAETDHILQLSELHFDKKCGTIDPVPAEVLKLVEENESKFEKRQISPKQWKLPDNEYTIRDLQPNVSYLIKIRLMNKYKYGEFSTSFPVEMKHRPSTPKPSSPIPDIQFEELKMSSDSESDESKSTSSSSEDDSSDNEQLAVKTPVKSPMKSPMKSPVTKEEVKEKKMKGNEIELILKEGVNEILRQVEAGIDLTKLRTNSGLTLLHAAVQANQLDLVQYCLQNNLFSVNVPTSVSSTIFFIIF